MTFRFDEKEHAYFLDDKPLHGVTSILSVIAKPMLIQWSANMAVDYIQNALAEVQNVADKTWEEVMKPLDLDKVFKEARIAHRLKKEKAGELGTGVHKLIETLCNEAIQANGGLLKPDTKSDNAQVQKFIDWALEKNVRFIESEKMVYSRESWYAGTFDLILEIDGKKYIADIKTSSGIYPEAYLQMAAYQNALAEMGEHEDIQGAAVINLDKKGGFQVGMNYDYEGNRLAFLGALTLHKQLRAIK